MKETRRTFRDSESGIEKMAIGRHLGHKSHEIERRRLRGGDIEEETHFNGLDEGEEDVSLFHFYMILVITVQLQ